MRSRLCAFAALFTLGCQHEVPSAPPSSAREGALAGARSEDVNGRYLVRLARRGRHPSEVARDIERSYGLRAGVRGVRVLRVLAPVAGATHDLFVADVGHESIDELRRDPRIEAIESDAPVSALQSPSWGLDRVNQRNGPGDGYNARYPDGRGVRLYLLDTGIWDSHPEFGGRASRVWSATGGNGIDCRNHGTPVAGIAASSTYGIAPRMLVHSLHVTTTSCGDSVHPSDVADALRWVLQHHQKPAVVNMSLLLDANFEVDQAVRDLVNAGVPVVVAAGNQNSNACNYSPAREPLAITVGAVSPNAGGVTNPRWVLDQWRGSNFGGCVDLFAPGDQIVTTAINNLTMVHWMTSMAAPHVAGMVGALLQVEPTMTPAAISGWLTSNATLGVVTNPGNGTPNRLLFDPRDARPTLVASLRSWEANDSEYYRLSVDPLNGGLNTYEYEWQRSLNQTTWTTVATTRMYPHVLSYNETPQQAYLRVRVTSGDGRQATSQVWTGFEP